MSNETVTLLEAHVDAMTQQMTAKQQEAAASQATVTELRSELTSMAAATTQNLVERDEQFEKQQAIAESERAELQSKLESERVLLAKREMHVSETMGAVAEDLLRKEQLESEVEDLKKKQIHTTQLR